MFAGVSVVSYLSTAEWRDLTVGATITADDMGSSDSDYDAILNFLYLK